MEEHPLNELVGALLGPDSSGRGKSSTGVSGLREPGDLPSAPCRWGCVGSGGGSEARGRRPACGRRRGRPCVAGERTVRRRGPKEKSPLAYFSIETS